ncbi:MAG: TonB family protein [Luteitalea sp.]|nr:TonB family protein [Luteitalea sp.]
MSDSATPSGGTVERTTRSGYVAVQLHDVPQAEPSLLDWVPTRLRNSLGVSVVVHIVAGALLGWILTWPPPTPQVAAPREEQVQMVYLNVPGPGGGGGGGGNQQEEPPRRLEQPGPDAVSIPEVEEAPLEPLREVEPPEPEPPEPPKVVLPVMTVASSAVELKGAILEPPKATMSQGSGSKGGAGSGEGAGSGPGEGSGLGPGRGGGTGGGAYRPGAGIDIPRILREIKPQYTAEAMRAKIQGTVWLECIVNTEGRCTNVRVTRSLDPTFGLDQEAVKAAQQWEFAPGKRQSDGVAVSVIISIGMDFTLR